VFANDDTKAAGLQGHKCMGIEVIGVTFFDSCSCSKKWLQLLLRNSLEIDTPTPVSTPKTWRQYLFCLM